MKTQSTTHGSIRTKRVIRISAAAMIAGAVVVSSLWSGPSRGPAQVRPIEPVVLASGVVDHDRPRIDFEPTSLPVPATASTLAVGGLGPDGRASLLVSKSLLLTTNQPIERVSVGSAEIAEVNLLTPTSFLLTARAAGSTDLMVWDESEQMQSVQVVVETDLSVLTEELRRSLPGVEIQVSAAQDGVVLRGRVPDLHAARHAQQLAEPFGRVINLLEIGGGQQVMLQVRFMEVSRTALSALGVDIAAGVQNADFALGIASVPGRLVDRAFTVSGEGSFGDFAFEGFIDALKRNNLARVLAEPNLTVISGEEGDFLAGGEVPIPVPQSGAGGGGTITIEYREFGVRLKCTPVVLGDGRIRLRVMPEVSELDYSNGTSIGGEVVPGLRTRKVNTVVEMADGQTFMLAGLLNRKVDTRVNATPLLGDLPVIGTLFRSVRYERSETELVILVTPRLVSPMNPDELPMPAGERWRYPNEAELFFLGDAGSPAAANRPMALESRQSRHPNQPAPRFHGAHGFAEVDPAELDVAASVNP